jgi:hypothetical protein
VIIPASTASPTVVASVTGRLLCGAADIATPVPRYRGGAPAGLVGPGLRDRISLSRLSRGRWTGTLIERRTLLVRGETVWMSVMCVPPID